MVREVPVTGEQPEKFRVISDKEIDKRTGDEEGELAEALKETTQSIREQRTALKELLKEREGLHDRSARIGMELESKAREKLLKKLEDERLAKQRLREEARKPDIEVEELAKKEPVVEEVVPKTAQVGILDTTEKVKKLSVRLEELKQKFVELHAEAAKKATGGIATPEGVLASQQRVLDDPDKWSGRVGGRARIRGEAADEIREEARLVNDVTKELREQSNVLDGLKSRHEEIKDKIEESAQMEFDVSSVDEAKQKLTELGEEVNKVRDKVKESKEDKWDTVVEEVKPSGVEEPITEIDIETSGAEKNLDNLKLRLDEVYRAIRDTKENLEKLSTSRESGDIDSIREETSTLQALDKEKKELLATIKEEIQARGDLDKSKQTDDSEKEIADTAKETQGIREKTDALNEQTKARETLRKEEETPVESDIGGGVVSDQDSADALAKKMGIDSSLFEKDKGLQELFKKNKDAALNLQVALDKLNKEIGKYGDEVTSQQSKGKLLTNGLREYTTVIGTAEGQTLKLVQSLNASNKALSESQMQAREAAIAAKDLAQSFQTIDVASKERYDLASQAAGKAGFQQGDLKSIYTQHPAGVTFFKYEMKDAMGVTQKYEVVLDKFGKELTRTNRRLLGFAESVKKNTIELIKWSVGVTLVYGTYYKFQQLLETAIDNQAKLAAVAVTLGNAQRDLNEIFDDAAKVAAATGESINAILETYTFAYRAVGAIADPIERTAKANKLLTDATILNKLSSLDAASSIDVLAGSLRQLQLPSETIAESFNRGTDLLDKWVVTTRNANVDLSTLAMAFSVTAESAGNAGMSIEELNAVIASLAEKIGGLGGRETGNAVRAMIGGVYQEQAADILAKYGVAVKDTNGQMREFLEISRDIYELYNAGIISATELNKIGLVWGGGVRRGQQIVAFLSDYNNILSLVDKQSDSVGASQQALGIIMETLQVTLTKLGNSVQNLAQTMGTEGGLLGAANSVLGIMIKLVDTTESLTELFGKLTIPAAILGMGAGYFSLGGSIGAARRTDFAGKIGGATQGMMGGMMGALPFFNRTDLQNIKPVFGTDGKVSHYAKAQTGLIFAQGADTRVGVKGAQTLPARANTFMQENYWGMMPGMFAGISRAGEGDYSGAGITMASTFIGAAKWGPWGALVGTIIAEMFVNKIIESKADLTDALPSPLKQYKDLEEEEPAVSEISARREVNTKAIIDAAGIPLESMIGAVLTNYSTIIAQAFGAEGSPIYTPVTPGEEAPSIWGKREDYIEKDILSDEFARLSLEIEEKRYYALKKSGEAIDDATEARHREIEALLEEADLLGARKLDPISVDERTFTKEVNRIAELRGEYLTDLGLAFREQVRTLMVEGEILPKGFREKLQVEEGSEANVAAIAAAFEIVGYAAADSEESMDKFFSLITQASPEVVTTLIQLVGEINEIQTGLDTLDGEIATATIELHGVEKSKEQLEKMLVSVGKDMTIYVDKSIESVLNMQMAKLGRPKTIMDGFEGLDPSQMKMVIEEAAELEDIRLQAQVDIDPNDEWSQDWKDELVRTAEPIFVYLGELFGFELAKGIVDSEALKEALLNLQESMQIQQQDVGYRFFDATQAQMDAIMPRYDAIRQSILAAGGTSTESGLLAFFQNSSSPVYMQKDWAIIQFLLSALLKTNTRQLKTNQDQLKAEEKQLEGIYNLPGGASFYVPFDAYAMKQKEEGGVGGLEEPVQEFAAAVDQFSSSLADLISEFPENYDYEGAYETLATREDMIEAIREMYLRSDKWEDVQKFREQIAAPPPDQFAYDVPLPPDWEPPIDVNVLNIGELAIPLPKEIIPFGGENPTEVIQRIIEMYVTRAQSVLEWLKDNLPTEGVKKDDTSQTPDTGGGLSKTGEISLDNFADTFTILKGLGDDVESGVSNGMSELGTQISSGLSPTKTTLDSLVAQLILQNKQGLGGDEFDIGEALSGGTITLSDVNFTVPNIATKLQMNIQVNTQLTLDGYMLWQGIKDYARADLVTFAGVSGTGVATYVV